MGQKLKKGFKAVKKGIDVVRGDHMDDHVNLLLEQFSCSEISEQPHNYGQQHKLKTHGKPPVLDTKPKNVRSPFDPTQKSNDSTSSYFVRAKERFEAPSHSTKTQPDEGNTLNRQNKKRKSASFERAKALFEPPQSSQIEQRPRYNPHSDAQASGMSTAWKVQNVKKRFESNNQLERGEDENRSKQQQVLDDFDTAWQKAGQGNRKSSSIDDAPSTQNEEDSLNMIKPPVDVNAPTYMFSSSTSENDQSEHSSVLEASIGTELTDLDYHAIDSDDCDDDNKKTTAHPSNNTCVKKDQPQELSSGDDKNPTACTMSAINNKTQDDRYAERSKRLKALIESFSNFEDRKKNFQKIKDQKPGFFTKWWESFSSWIREKWKSAFNGIISDVVFTEN